MTFVHNIKTLYPAPFITLREDKRPGGWAEIGVYVDPIIPTASKILVAVITHPCTGAKWFVYPSRSAGIGGRVRCATRKAAIDAALGEARSSDAYKLHEELKTRLAEINATPEKPRFYADLNPAYGARNEKRWVVFDRETGRPAPRAICPQYASPQFARSAANRLNELEAQ